MADGGEYEDEDTIPGIDTDDDGQEDSREQTSTQEAGQDYLLEIGPSTGEHYDNEIDLELELEADNIAEMEVYPLDDLDFNAGIAVEELVGYGPGDPDTGSKRWSYVHVVELSKSLFLDHKIEVETSAVLETIRSTNALIASHTVAVRVLARGDGQDEDRLVNNTVHHLSTQDIKDMFEMGESDYSLKMQPGSMLAQLKLMYPGRYSLPGEMDIRTKISTMTQARKSLESRRKKEVEMEKQQRLAEAEATDRSEVYVPPAGKRARTKTERFPKIYQQDIMGMVEADTEIK
ncbi:hypothetical protein SARC_11489 [Sphaeroforma arctica JP610]|uniref:Uncharacterized protein n=1 Tax=Sphaeroforma arctica JP610 TaxID=667725 RepID=A0A0L0FGU4_9EUKA|nr:hypothetical protein SARC_11489 [Sphaeroforma arctica JP610]KNC75999.1 hypothetical protein SARC_11489 [Sphaeroforma arctica JP610]|eukprot:XP_014149901.1 hypothetical protein SARC_11489 [Sphaeroforma arctica JP610]